MQWSHANYTFIVRQQNQDCVLTSIPWERFIQQPPGTSFALIESSLPKYKEWLYMLYIQYHHRPRIHSTNRKRRRQPQRIVAVPHVRSPPRKSEDAHQGRRRSVSVSSRRSRRAQLSDSESADDWPLSDAENNKSSRSAL